VLVFVGVFVGVVVGVGVGVGVKYIKDVPVRTQFDASTTFKTYSSELSYGDGMLNVYGISEVVILSI
jgi:hypothetical protein